MDHILDTAIANLTAAKSIGPVPADSVTRALFWACVAAIALFARMTGLSYEAANLLIFLVFQPAVILALVLALIVQRQGHRRSGSRPSDRQAD